MLQQNKKWYIILLAMLSLLFVTGCQSTTSAKTPPLVQCPISDDQPNRFALCATANCWTLDNVAYCKCDVMNAKSISISYDYTENGESKNVCDLLMDGINNDFTISTYATPPQVTADYNPQTEDLGPPLAIYTCLAQNDTPIYGAQCDGGVCFNSTTGKNFPGLGPIADDEIVCSCPPAANVLAGFQITGPWNCEPGDANKGNTCCDESYHSQMCGVTSFKNTGTVMQVSAPIGTPTLLSTLLDGTEPSTNNCHFPRKTQ
jgi:hypothetical protein